jgi:ribosomal protein L12E/L44/L45/RPP1/RPP2
MKSFLGAFLALALLGATAAQACNGPQPPNCNCNQSTGQWEVNVSASAGASSSSKATGGNASATGGNANQQQQQSLNNSGNSSNTNNVSATGGTNTNKVSNANTNNVSNVANGGTGGAGGSASSSIASGAVKNTNTQTTSIGAVGSTSSVGNVSGGTSSASADGNGNGSNNTNVTYEAAKTYRQPVATAYSASLTSGMDTCLGSASAGAQTQILGLTFGKTYVDKNCVLIKQTKLLREAGLERSACKRMQMHAEGADIKEAMAEAGEDCPPLAAPTPVEAPVAAAPVDAVTHQELRVVEDRITTKVLSK